MDYSQELPRFNRKWLEKCAIEKRQPYQAKPVEVEKVHPKRTRPKKVTLTNEDSCQNSKAQTHVI